MKEKDFQTSFGKWLKASWRESAVFELKICKEKRFNLKRIEEHQLYNLKLAKSGCLYYKISDGSVGQKPMDCFTFYRSKAYLVILFYEPRTPKVLYMIDIDKILKLIKNGAKSITENEASILADCIGILKS